MASLLDFLPLFQETAATIRARLDADVNRDIPLHDPRWIDTREGSFYWDVTQPLVLELARVYDSLALDVPASAFALFAWGTYLDEHAAVFGLERKAAVAATGDVQFVGDPGTLVATGVVVAAEPTDAESDAVEFATIEEGVVAAQIDAPTGLAATPSNTGGTLATATYYYTVTAENEYGETLASAEVSAAVTGPTGSVALDWNDVTGATGYRLYRSATSGDPGGLVYDGAASTFTDTGAVSPNMTDIAPEINGTGGVTLEVQAVEPGTAGNVGALAVTDIISPLPGIDAVSNPAATVGGTDTELDEELRERVLLEFEGGGGGNVNDYRRWALSYPGVGRVHVEPVWDGPGTVLVVVMTAAGDPVASTVVDGLQEFLDPTSGAAHGEAPPGITVTVATPTVREIDVVATVTHEAGYSLDGAGGTAATREDIERELANYIDNLAVGEDVIYNHVVAQFFRVDGVLNVSGVTIEGGTADVAITTDPAQVAQLGTVTLS